MLHIWLCVFQLFSPPPHRILHVSSSLILKSSFYLIISSLEYFQAVLTGIYIALDSLTATLPVHPCFSSLPLKNPSALAKLISPLFLENAQGLKTYSLSPVFINTAHWNTAMPVCLPVVYSCFHANDLVC